MKPVPNSLNQRWLRTTVTATLLISICILLAIQTHTGRQALEKIPLQGFAGKQGSEHSPEKTAFVEAPPILDESPVVNVPPVTERPPIPTLPPIAEKPSDQEKPSTEKESSKEGDAEKPSAEKEASKEGHEEKPSAEKEASKQGDAEKEGEAEKEKAAIPEPPEYILATKKTSSDQEKLAYLTFLSGTLDANDDMETDNYFIAVRILVWQLVHNPETRTKHDVIVMVTPKVSQARRDRLKRDGAIVYPVELLHTPHDGWLKPEKHRWDDVMTKMRAWELIQYDRILMLDGDSMLLRSLDPVFDDPAAQLLATKPSNDTTLPSTYLVASNSEVWNSNHEFPPGYTTGVKDPGYMNAGFLILAPSLAAFEHYKSLIDQPNSFDSKYPEQNLINHVHRWDGPMPWRELAYTWNLRCPNDIDIEKGLYSVHEKWWEQPFIYGNEKTKQWLLTRRWEMKGWYDAWDRMHEETAPQRAGKPPTS